MIVVTKTDLTPETYIQMSQGGAEILANLDEVGTAINNIQADIVGSYTPLNVSNLRAWYDFSDGNSLTLNSGYISSFADKSYNSNTGVQNSASIRPEWSATSFNTSYPGVRFNRPGNLNCGSASTVDDIFVGGGTIMALFTLIGDGSNQSIYGKSSDGFVANGSTLLFYGTGTTLTLRFYHAASVSAGNWDVSGIPKNVPQLLELYYNSSTPTVPPVIRINGRLRSVTTAFAISGTINSDAAADLALGNISDGGGQPFLGALNQFLIVKGQLPASQRPYIYAYLASLGGMTIDRIYAMAGQSNMVGNAAITSELFRVAKLPVKSERPKIWDTQRFARLVLGVNNQGLDASSFGPEISFGLCMSQYISHSASIVKHAVGATSLAVDWNPSGGTHYAAFKSRLQAALNSSADAGRLPIVMAMMWTQGETDAQNLTNSNAYQANLTAFIASVASDVLAGYTVAPDYKFVISGLPSQSTSTIPYQDKVRAAQVAVGSAAGNAYVYTTDLPMNSDAVHLNSVGAITLGKRLASAVDTSFAQEILNYTS